MKQILYVNALLSAVVFASAQDIQLLSITGRYHYQDSVRAASAYLSACLAVESMHQAMDAIWSAEALPNTSRKAAREQLWQQDSAFMKWLGAPDRMRMARRKINRIYSTFQKRMTLQITKESKGKCRDWISAWTLPFGKVKIRLCEDYFIYQQHLQDKILIHEVGHEIGILFHRRIHGCRAAKRAAKSKSNVAKRSTENYAWLAVSFHGRDCGRLFTN